MKTIMTNRFKILAIITLVLVATGMFLLGFLGMNESPDYKPAYEIQVSVEQNSNGVGAVIDNAAKTYFEENNVKISSYATQTADDGATYIYKLTGLDGVDKDKLDTAVKEAVKKDFSAYGYETEVKVYETKNVGDKTLGFVLLGLGIAAVAMFVYALIVEKLASGIATISSALISIITFVALLAITRIPVSPTMWALAGGSMLFGGALSVAMTNRFKETMKLAGNEKLSSVEIAEIGVKNSIKRYIVLGIMALAIAITFIVCGFLSSLYLAFVGVQIILMAVSAALSSFVFTPAIWAAIKKTK